MDNKLLSDNDLVETSYEIVSGMVKVTQKLKRKKEHEYDFVILTKEEVSKLYKEFNK